MIPSSLLSCEQSHHSLLPVQPFAPLPNVTTTNARAANPLLLVPAYRTAKSIAQCWTQFCIKSRHSSPVSPFHFHQQGQQDLLAGAAKGAAAPEGAQGPSQPGWGHTRGCFRRADPQLQSVWQPGQTHRARAQLLHGKLILCRYTQTSSSCSYFFGLLYSRHFTGTSVSLGPSWRKKCCFGGFGFLLFFFFITTLTYPRHILVHEVGKEGREIPA